MRIDAINPKIELIRLADAMKRILNYLYAYLRVDTHFKCVCNLACVRRNGYASNTRIWCINTRAGVYLSGFEQGFWQGVCRKNGPAVQGI